MNKKILFALIFGIICAVSILWAYSNYIQKQKSSLEEKIYTDEAAFMEKNLASMIDEKRKSTAAIAITLASNDLLPQLIQNSDQLKEKITTLIQNYNKYTNYKNIWIHILDKNLHSIYRSWTTNNDDTFCTKRADLEYVLHQKKIISVISIDAFSISIKAILPLYDTQGKLLGLIEVISHFNSISKGLKKLDIDSVVVVDKENSKYIKYPFTKTLVEDRYIANFDAPKNLLSYLKRHDIKNYCQPLERVENGYIIASHPLKGYNGKIIAYYIMFKNIKNVSKTDLNFFVFKWSVFAVIFLMALAGIINIVLYFYIRKQKAYYKKILDTSSNIVLINDTKEIIDANRTFFKYFHMYTTIEEFRDKHGCICDFFVDEDEYLNRGKNENSWIDYILQNNHKTHKVKMNIEDKTYYFMIYVSLISQEQEHYSVIFADITEQELYKKELESLSLHDPLTHVGNRRKYEKRIADEIARACRYDTTFCVIEFDIDFFKKVNDTYGHQKGDEVLQEYSKLVAKHLRTVDEVFRIGGEEFIIIAPHISKEEAVRLAQKLRESIEQHKKVIEITASFGVAEYQLCENEEELFKRVDSALYEAKDSGRNRVVAK